MFLLGLAQRRASGGVEHAELGRLVQKLPRSEHRQTWFLSYICFSRVEAEGRERWQAVEGRGPERYRTVGRFHGESG